MFVDDGNAATNSLVFVFGRRGEAEQRVIPIRLPETFVRQTSEASAHPFELVVFGGKHTTLRHFVVREGRGVGFVWGRIFDIRDGTAETAENTLVASVLDDRPQDLNHLGGLFVGVIADTLNGRLWLVTDCLGARPFFIAESDGALIGGSHALLLAQQLRGAPKADMGAVSQYLALGYNATNKSLIAGIERLDAAACVRWRPGTIERRVYNGGLIQQRAIGAEAMAERIHQIMLRSFRHWTAGRRELAFALSGGYDSRYLAALSRTLADQGSKKRFINIANEDSETLVAREVSKRLDLPLEVVPIRASEWDSYAPEPIFHCRPDGFPVTKSICRLVARAAPNTSVVDGYLGDALVRGHLDGMLGRPESETHGDVNSAVLHRMTGSDLNIFAKEARGLLVRRAQAEARALLARHATEGHVIAAADIYLRQRSYISNNFLQNIHESEPCLPYLDPELVALKRTYPTSDFGVTTFQRIFSDNCPQLDGLGHNSDLKLPFPDRVSWTERRAVATLMRELLTDKFGPIVDRRWVTPRLALAAILPKFAYGLMAMMFLSALLHLCNKHGIGLEWEFD